LSGCGGLHNRMTWPHAHVILHARTCRCKITLGKTSAQSRLLIILHKTRLPFLQVLRNSNEINKSVFYCFIDFISITASAIFSELSVRLGSRAPVLLLWILFSNFPGAWARVCLSPIKWLGQFGGNLHCFPFYFMLHLRNCVQKVRHFATMTIQNAKTVWRKADAVCFDVDSTVIMDEGIDELAAFCGRGKEVSEW